MARSLALHRYRNRRTLFKPKHTRKSRENTVGLLPKVNVYLELGFFCLFVFCITLNTKIKRTVRRTPDVCTVGQCKALYSFTPQRSDELTLKEGTGGGREYCPKSAKSRMEMYKTNVCSQEIYSTFTPRKRMAGGLAHSMARRVIFHPPMWRSCLC